MRNKRIIALLASILLLLTGCSGEVKQEKKEEETEKREWAASDSSIHSVTQLSLTNLEQKIIPPESGVIVQHKLIDEIPVLELYPADAKLLPMIFFLHEHEGAKEQFLDEAITYAQAGYFCVLFDLRGYGERISPESIESIEAAVMATTDLDLLLEYYRLSPFGDSGRFALYGQSMGGSAVWHYAAYGKKAPMAIVACSAASDFSVLDDMGAVINGKATEPQWDENTFRNYCAAHNPINKTERFANLPMLVYQGLNDHTIPAKLTQQFEAAILQGNSHSLFVYDETGGHDVTASFLKRILPFIRQYLK